MQASSQRMQQVVERRQEEELHKETPERIHVVHERDETEGHRRMHTEGIGCNKPNIGQEGETRVYLSSFSFR